jgi:hypothetical protein
VIEEIKDRLVNLGHRSGITPDKAEDAANHLYATAYAVATRQKDRELTRADLLRILHERTHVSLPAATAGMLFAAMPRHLVPAGALPLAVGGKSGIIALLPPLPSRYYARAAVLADIGGRLSAHPALVLQGGTGVGKSIAALGYAVASASSWGWVNLRGVQAMALRETLDRVAAELAAEDGLTDIVLDDIELPGDSRLLEAPLARIRVLTGERGGHLVITSAVQLPQRLSLALGLSASGTLSIPAFTREEIKEFLLARGCPTPEVADFWAAFIEVHTSGHAQLVHARLATLEAEGFPKPEMASALKTPSDVVEAQAEARRLIAGLDGSGRELLYRLSLTMHALPRQQVFAIAARAPAITEPGLAFDTLVGPWIEVLSEGLYRISPLARGVGSEVQGMGWATAMHSSIAHALLGFRTLTPTDVSAILFHATTSRDWSVVGHLSLGITKWDDEVWEAVAESANWFLLVGTGGAARPEGDEFSLFLMRLFQLRLAVAAHDNGAADSIIASMDAELPANVEGPPLRLARHFFLGQVLLRTELQPSMARFISMGVEYIRLTDELKDMLASVHERALDSAIIGPDGSPDLAGIVGFTLSPRVNNRQTLSALLDACEVVEASIVRRLLWFVGGAESTAQFIFDRVWLSETNSSAPDWLACRDVFQRAYALARRCDLPGLAQGAARAIARLTDENLDDPAEALRLADEMAAQIGRSFGQDDQRATVLLHKGDTAEALAIWRDLLPRWQPKDEFDLQQTFSHRLAAVAAARLNEWKESAEWLRRARGLVHETNQAIYRAGLLVDEGYAQWKSGDNRGALDCFVCGLDAIDRLPPDDVDQGAYLLRKRTGHTMMWIAGTAAGDAPKKFAAPPPAWCSGLEPVKGPKEPSTSSDAMWVYMLEFEFAADLGDAQFRAHEGRLRGSRYGLFRIAFNRLRLQHRLRRLALDDFVEVVADYAEAVEVWRRYHKEGGLGSAEPLPARAAIADRRELDAELVLSVMVNPIFSLCARGELTEEVLERWSAGAAVAGLSEMMAPWLMFIGALFITNTLSAETEMRNASHPWPWQIIASIRAATDRATDPADLLVVHDYWAKVLRQAAPAMLVLGDVEHLVTRAWRQLCEKTFLLRSPTVTVGPLKDACASPSIGWPKIGGVLVAACDVVPKTVPGEFRTRFGELAKEGVNRQVLGEKPGAE